MQAPARVYYDGPRMPEIEIALVEVEIDRAGDDLRVLSRGSRDERPAPHVLGPAVQPVAFASAVREAATRGKPLGARLADAKLLHGAVFREGTSHLLTRLAE